jgi:hypothetical protein
MIHINLLHKARGTDYSTNQFCTSFMQILEGAQVMKSLMPIFPLLNKGVANAGGMLHEVKEKKFS